MNSLSLLAVADLSVGAVHRPLPRETSGRRSAIVSCCARNDPWVSDRFRRLPRMEPAVSQFELPSRPTSARLTNAYFQTQKMKYPSNIETKPPARAT